LKSLADDDANHFHPGYFGAGKVWHDPNVDEMKRGFRICQRFIEANGGRILDCTEGGRLSFIPKILLSEALDEVGKQ
jgi:hypothetical protein